MWNESTVGWRIPEACFSGAHVSLLQGDEWKPQKSTGRKRNPTLPWMRECSESVTTAVAEERQKNKSSHKKKFCGLWLCLFMDPLRQMFLDWGEVGWSRGPSRSSSNRPEDGPRGPRHDHHHAPRLWGCQNLPDELRAQLARHRSPVGHLHHPLRHRQRGLLHSAVLDRGWRGHPAGGLLRAVSLLHRERAVPGLDLSGKLHRV